jgi:hypothetical protein
MHFGQESITSPKLFVALILWISAYAEIASESGIFLKLTPMRHCEELLCGIDAIQKLK